MRRCERLGAEKIGVRKEIGGHESAVTVAADADAMRIDYAHVRGFVDGGFRAGDDLLDIFIVGCSRRADDGHRGSVQEPHTHRARTKATKDP